MSRLTMQLFVRRRCLGLALLVLLLGTYGQGALSQGADTGATGKDQAWPKERCEPSTIADTFVKILTKTLSNNGHDPERETFHYVVLFNTAAVGGPDGEYIVSIYHKLLEDFLVGSPNASDMLSFVPFQLNLRDEKQYNSNEYKYIVWNKPFSRDQAQAFKKLTPDAQAPVSDLKGGNDWEKALLAALDNVEHPESSVYIVLSNSDVSQPPSKLDNTAANYQLANSSKANIDRIDKNLTLAGKGILYTDTPKQDGGRAYISVYWRIFEPRAEAGKSFAPLAQLQGTSRSDLLKSTPAPNPGPGTGPAPSPGPKPEPGPAPAANPPDYTGAIVIAVIVVLAIAGIAAFLAMNRPLRLRIGVTSPGDMSPVYGAPFDLKRGRPLYLSGSDGDDRVRGPGLPEKVAVAKFEITGFSAVKVSGEAWQVEGSPVIISGTEPQTVKIGPDLSGGLGSDTFTLVIERAS